MSRKKQIIRLEAIMPTRSQTYELDKSESVFGRGGNSDVIVRDGGISREHMKIKLENNTIFVMDLKSLNGTYIDGHKLNPNVYVAVQEKYKISFGKCEVTVKLQLIEKEASEKTDIIEENNESVKTPEIKNEESSSHIPNPESYLQAKFANVVDSVPELIEEVKKEAEAQSKDVKTPAVDNKTQEDPVPNKFIDLSAFPKTEEDYRINFKNVGLDLPKYKNPGEHAKEIIQEAEYQKYAIIKNAEVFRSKTINETRILSKKAGDEAYAEYKKMVDQLLDNTRKELKKLRTDTEILLDGKRQQANEEIQKLWEEHEEHIRKDKEKQISAYEKENKIKLDLSIEKSKSDMFAERHKLLTDAETEIIRKKVAYQTEFENEKNEHLGRLKIYNEELQKTQEAIEENKKVYKESKELRDEAELELSKVQSSLKTEKENLAIITDSFKETEENHKLIENEIANFNQTKNKAIADIEAANAELQKLNSSYTVLSEKKLQIEEEIQKISDHLKDAKMKAKSEIENEYANLKSLEAKKFDDFKANELKELQKIRDSHTASIKNFSVDLSQEIATKLELLASKSNHSKFDFEKNFELINSVIQIKGAVNTGSESKHAEQLENWKNRKRKEDFSLMAKGFAACLVFVFSAKFVYDKIHVDPLKEQMEQMARENKQRDVENRYEPVKTNKYYDNYVESTLYTENFTEVFLDKKNQEEWVNYATKYFLKQWKVDEEKVISVISNSNAIVQNIQESIPTLKKSKIKNDLAKLKELEDGYVQKQAAILGTNVKYEAYKKIEKEFFRAKLQGRVPAGQ